MRQSSINKRSQFPVRASHLKLAKILDHIPTALAFSTLSENPEVIFINELFERTFGYSMDEVPTVNDWAQHAYPDATYRNLTMTAWNREVAEAIPKQGTLEPKEFRVTCKNGEVRDVLIRATVIEDILLVSFDDITEQKKTAEQLRISEERHRRLAENANDVIWTMSLDGRMTFVSPAIEKVRGYTPDEASRQSIQEIMMPESARKVLGYLASLQKAVQDHSPLTNFKDELEYQCKDGTAIWTEVSVYPITAPDGAIKELLGLTRDVSERRRYEKELQQARIAAEAANAAKSKFLAHMSHEIRTPLNGVLGLAQLLEREPLSSTHQEIVHDILNAGNSLLGIINDILDFSKIEAGELQIENRPFKLGQLLAQMMTISSVSAKNRGITLRLEPLPKIESELSGDSLRLQQVIFNLIGNAIKFTEHGQVLMRVIVVDTSELTVKLRFEIEDTGVGMSPETLALIFKPFTQANGTISRRFGGTGLGLSISKRLVTLMGGDIGATSKLGVGSTFWFELPFAKTAVFSEATDHDQNAFSFTSPEGETQTKGSGYCLRILVVDDNTISLKVLEFLFKQIGISYGLAGNGQQALEILMAHPKDFDLVLMDIQMPVMDGLAATVAIRRIPELADLPVIALSANVFEDERKAAFLAGVNEYLTKPIGVKEIHQFFRRYNRRRST